MKLRQKLWVSVLIAAICVMSLVYGIGSFSVFQGFDHVENSEMRAHMNRLQEAYGALVENLKNRISDWAQWT
jgi:sensor domain CHASE-containing protein